MSKPPFIADLRARPSEGRVRTIAGLSILVALFVMALKFAAWWITGSVALFSDALESIVNIVAALAAWWTIRLSLKPPDANHPFGHHKAEYFSAVFEGILIALAALLIIQEAVRELAAPRVMSAPVPGLLVTCGAAVINAAWAWLLISTGRRGRYPSLVADGKHLRADVITSVGVIVGLVLALATGMPILDPLLALVVAANILWHGFRLVGSSVQGLMDEALGEAELADIRAVIDANAGGSIEYHDLKSRGAGRASFVEFHLVVPGEMAVRDAHAICDRIEAALRRELREARVVIHIEPDEKAKFADRDGDGG